MVPTFVVPALDGPVSGGTRYNGELLRALADAGTPVRAVGLDGAKTLLARGEPGRYFVDSLFLREVRELRALGRAGAELALVVHYFPSSVARALGDETRALERLEADAFSCAGGFLVPSALTKRELEARGVEGTRVVVIEPGCTLRPPPEAPSTARLSARIVANVVRNKGILEFLQALGGAASEADDFSLDIAGGESAEPPYARRCRAFVEAHAALATRVRFEGAVAPADVAERLARANLFVSASFSETYGMALDEARAVGVPIVALDAGNAAAHVTAGAGGELFATHAALAGAFARLSRDPREIERRVTAARAHASAGERRTWNTAALEFLRAFG